MSVFAVNYHLLGLCSNDRSKRLCAGVEEKAINDNPSNGALWLEAATIRASNDDLDGTIVALNQIISTPNFNSYWAETIDLFQQSYQLIGLQEQAPRYVMAIGNAAAMQMAPMQGIFAFCQKQAVGRDDIAQLCIDAGKKIAFKAKTILLGSIGYGLQKAVYSAKKDKTNLQIISKQHQAFQNNYGFNNDALNLMLFDHDLLEYWFTQLKLFGEQQANRRLTQEAIRLSKDPDYDPCPKPAS